MGNILRLGDTLVSGVEDWVRGVLETAGSACTLKESGNGASLRELRCGTGSLVLALGPLYSQWERRHHPGSGQYCENGNRTVAV